MKRITHKKVNEVEDHKQQQVKILDKFVPLENLDGDMDINRDQETIQENVKISATESLYCYRLKQHKTWFVKRCSELLDQRKQTKFQWLQDLNQIKRDNLNNVRPDTNGPFRRRRGNV